MRRMLLCLAFLPIFVFSQYHSEEFTSKEIENGSIIKISVTNADTIILFKNNQQVSGFFVSGTTHFEERPDCYVRITLKDVDNFEYLAYEAYPLLSQEFSFTFSKIGLETACLDNIQPRSIKIETHNATIVLDSTYFITSQVPLLI